MHPRQSLKRAPSAQVIADGDSKLSASMRALLEDMFPAFTARTFDPSWYEDDEGDETGEALPDSAAADWRSRSQVGVWLRRY